MRQVVELAWQSLSKRGEELCGDCVKIATTADSLTVVLSDGLGSGVKANILATLTAQIAGTMFLQGASATEVIETLAETLPECRVRQLAYATLAVITIQRAREAYLVEYDSPPLILVRDGKVLELPFGEQVINGRLIRETRFSLQLGDYMVMVSDGYEHAGVGGLYRLGWGWQNIATSVRRWASTGCDAHTLTQALNSTCLKLYDGKPGDDATAIGMRVRQAVRATILTGPPADKADDPTAVTKLMNAEGLKVICGGTTAQMAARELKQQLRVEWVPPGQRSAPTSRKKGTPPIARLEGVDLVTEGILTLGQALELLEAHETTHDLPPENDAATRLARILLTADEIHFILGSALNPNQIADVVRGESMRMFYVKDLVRQLERRTKKVTVERI
ncbi:MAG: SpoIIE family protein phosphatase [Anaerolineae bacterium]